MRGLLSTAASRAWMGVVAAGVVMVALVFGLQLLPRLSAGQEVIDAAQPAMTEQAVAARGRRYQAPVAVRRPRRPAADAPAAARAGRSTS